MVRGGRCPRRHLGVIVLYRAACPRIARRFGRLDRQLDRPRTLQTILRHSCGRLDWCRLLAGLREAQASLRRRLILRTSAILAAHEDGPVDIAAPRPPHRYDQLLGPPVLLGETV